jgi:hypothetical protein
LALTILITKPSGTVYRFGKDEPDAAWVPFGITFESVLPGGWKQGSFSLRRRIDVEVELSLLDEVEILGEDGDPVYEGRIQQLPRQHGDDYLLNVVCMGWAIHLTDDTSYSMIFRDMDWSGWGNASNARQRNNIAVPHRLEPTPSVAPDVATKEPGLQATITGPWGAGVNPLVEAVYDAGPGNRINWIYFGWHAAATVNVADPNWFWAAAVGDDDLPTSYVGTINLTFFGAGPAAGQIEAPDGDRRYGFLVFAYLTDPGADSTFFLTWTYVAVVGDHGLELHGDEPNAGYFIDDMIAHGLRNAAPKLNFTQGVEGSIQRPNLVVSHAVYKDPGTLEPVILDLNKYVLWEWFVYEKRTFYFRPTDPDRLCWNARLSEGIHLALEGDDAANAFNGCIVRYNLPDGTRRVAGPIGSGYDVEDATLGDTDPENVVNAHGYPRRWAVLDVSFPLLDQYAPILGAAYLAQASLPARSGDITLTWQINHPAKGLRPVREVRAGDWIRLTEHPADVPRRILSTRYSDDGRQCVVTVGNDLNKIDAILEMLGVQARVRLGG